MTYNELHEIAKKYAKPFVAKKSPILPSEIEDAYMDGYFKAIECINTLLDRKKMVINGEFGEMIENYLKENKCDQETATDSVFMFVDYITKQSEQ
jgi:hypothetical protein